MKNISPSVVSPATHRPAGGRFTSFHQLPTSACSRFVLLTLLLLLSGFNAFASDPVGIYGFVDKVVFEPNDTAPERAQVWGGFALARDRGDRYDAPQRGYLY